MSKYINQLTDEEIEKFFKNNGYELVKDLTDHNGFPIDAIDRGEDNIFVRARKLEIDQFDAELKSYLMQKSPGFFALYAITSMHSGFRSDIELIHFTDFFMSKFCITEEDEASSEVLLSSYLNYMAQKFPTYVEDLNEYCASLPDDNLEDDTM